MALNLRLGHPVNSIGCKKGCAHIVNPLIASFN